MDAGSRVLDIASLPTDVALNAWLADDRGSPALRARHLLGVLRQLQLADPDILILAGAGDDATKGSVETATVTAATTGDT